MATLWDQNLLAQTVNMGSYFNNKGEDRKSVVQGKSVDLGGRRIIKKKKNKKNKKKNKKKHNRIRVTSIQAR